MAEDKIQKSKSKQSEKASEEAKAKMDAAEEIGKEDTSEPKTSETESTEERFRKVGEKLTVAADKGVEVIKDVFGKVKDFSVDAAELTKLKVEVHRLKSERDRLYTVMGEKLWELRKSEKVKEIQSIFEKDFNHLEELNKNITKKEKDASKISL